MSEVSEAAGVLIAALIVDCARAVDPVISPDGRWVTWVTSSAGGRGSRVRELWLASVAGTTAPVRLADGGVRLPCWSADSAWLFYLAGAELRRRRSSAVAGSPPTARAETTRQCCVGMARSPGWLRSPADG